ncbi:MAG: hypothetical protein FWE91_00230 [Defluviitaleaceae bacterium]|nr:hypothetical protein [Defluviitaleaceae bacterium]MCL2836914.1 hypothetical protein [Defluviitaleaceae bacterium]
MATFELNSGMLNTAGSAGSIAGRPGHGERFEREPQNEHVCTCGRPNHECTCGHPNIPQPLPPIKQESVIALKIYDSCRQQDCLDEDELGPARCACNQHIGDKCCKEGEIIIAPPSAASVSVEDLRIRRILIVNKRHNPFKRGFWDIDLKYCFEYKLVFREACGREIGSLRAISTFNKMVTLFGSIGSDIVVATDLLRENDGESPTLSLDPFVLVEAKAVALSAKLKYCRHRNHCDDDHIPAQVIVTIGLFTIIKLYRIVTLMVESRGFTIPKHCDEFSPVNVCDYFGRLPFPMDVFAPPQRREFEAGISGDIHNEPCDGHHVNVHEHAEA